MYMRRPTRHGPPISRDEPSVYVALDRGEECVMERLIRGDGPWKSADARSICIAGACLALADDGGMSLELAGCAGIEAALRLRPAYSHEFKDHPIAGDEDGQEQALCTYGGGHYEIEGTLGLVGSATPFAGRATHRHAWGLPEPSASSRLKSMRFGQ
jgi:hypothetical protein